MADARTEAIEKFRSDMCLAEIRLQDGKRAFRVFTGAGKPRADIVCCTQSNIEIGIGMIAEVGPVPPEFKQMPVTQAMQVIDSDGPDLGWVLLLNAEDWDWVRHVNIIHHRVH